MGCAGSSDAAGGSGSANSGAQKQKNSSPAKSSTFDGFSLLGGKPSLTDDAKELKDMLKPFGRVDDVVPQLEADLNSVVFEKAAVAVESVDLASKMLAKIKTANLVNRYPNLFSLASCPWSDLRYDDGPGVGGYPTSGGGKSMHSASTIASALGFNAADDLVHAVKALALAIDTVLSPSLALIRNQTIDQEELPEEGDIPEAVLSLDEAEDVHNGITVLCILAKECGFSDRRLVDAMKSVCVSEVAFLIQSHVFLPSAGMQTVDKVEEEVKKYREIYRSWGVLPRVANKGSSSGGLIATSQLPLFLFKVTGKQSLLYLQCILDGQKKFSLNPVPRHNMLESTGARVSSFAESPTFKLFPVFQRRGMGTERGEGHGLRKEFFDGVARMLTSHTTEAHEMSDYVRLSAKSKTKLEVNWSSSEASAMIHLAAGDSIEIHEEEGAGADSPTKGKRSGGGGVTTVTVQSIDEASSAPLMTVVQLRPPGLQQLEAAANASTIAFRKAVTPLFEESGDETGRTWLHAGLPNPSENDKVRKNFSALGVILANGPANGVVFPANFPPLLFQMLMQPKPSEAIRQWQPKVEDLVTIFPTVRDEISQIEGLAPSDFEALLEAEGLEKKTSKQKYIDEHLVSERLFPPNSKHYLAALAEGFHKSGLPRCRLLQETHPEEIGAIFCGARDDGISDFKFKEHFEFTIADDMLNFQHGVVFQRLFFQLIDEEMDSSTKRQLLQFITGRTLLPSWPKSERITIEFTSSPMNARDYNKLRPHLPASHSCDNVLDLPNYMEAVLFDGDGLWYEASGKEPGVFINRQIREKAWKELSKESKQEAEDDCFRLLKDKLLTAISQSSGYELDEGVVTDEIRQRDEQDLAGMDLPTFTPRLTSRCSSSNSCRSANRNDSSLIRAASSPGGGTAASPLGGGDDDDGEEYEAPEERVGTNNSTSNSTANNSRPPSQQQRPDSHGGPTSNPSSGRSSFQVTSGEFNGNNTNNTSGGHFQSGGSPGPKSPPPTDAENYLTAGSPSREHRGQSTSADLDDLMEELGYDKK